MRDWNTYCGTVAVGYDTMTTSFLRCDRDGDRETRVRNHEGRGNVSTLVVECVGEWHGYA